CSKHKKYECCEQLNWRDKMTVTNYLKITLIGAGSTSFGPATITDIMLSDLLNTNRLEVCLMDISERALEVSEAFAHQVNQKLKRNINVWSTTDLDASLEQA